MSGSGNTAGEYMGRLRHGPTRNALVTRTIEFIQASLGPWRDSLDDGATASENALNERLCMYLNACSRKCFPMVCFNREIQQGGRRAVDLSASPAEPLSLDASTYGIYDHVLCIECKRLPAPSGNREREYVSGGQKKNGGMQRFKLGLYASDHDVALLIGYIQRDDAMSWRTRIDSWIGDLVRNGNSGGCSWKDDEALDELSMDDESGVSSLKSSHGRTGQCVSGRIVLRHLWVRMNAQSRCQAESSS